MIPLEPATGKLRRKDGEPIFAEPWTAQALAMADFSPDELEQRREDWEHAYLATPHGKPVKLKHQAET